MFFWEKNPYEWVTGAANGLLIAASATYTDDGDGRAGNCFMALVVRSKHSICM